MKLKHLESYLSNVASFENPQVHLEQISTPADIAAKLIFIAANNFSDISDLSVGDFGMGPGMLSIAASALGAYHVTGFEIDSSAIETCWINVNKLEISSIDIVQANVPSIELACNFDTVIMNPPFGTRNSGIDTAFVSTGMENSSVVYSLHKTSTRDHFVRFAEANTFKLEVLAELRYPIPRQFGYHKETSKDVAVDLYRFTHIS